MIVFQEQLHGFCEIGTGDKCLSQHSMRAQVQSQPELQTQSRITGERLRIGYHLIEVGVVDPGANRCHVSCCERRTRKQ